MFPWPRQRWALHARADPRDFARHLGNPLLDTNSDAAVLPWDTGAGELVFTTGQLHGPAIEFRRQHRLAGGARTTNDLAWQGRSRIPEPRVILEEGLDFAVLERVVAGIAAAANEIGVVVAAGDTKVVRRGEGGGIYLIPAASELRTPRSGSHRSHPGGDVVLVSGSVGDHGIAVMLAREQFGLRGDLKSDAASVLPLTRALAAVPGLRFMRDPTRGGLATVTHEIVQATGLGVVLQEAKRAGARFGALGVRDARLRPVLSRVRGPRRAVVAADDANRALAALRSAPGGGDAAIIGAVREQPARVVLETAIAASA